MALIKVEPKTVSAEFCGEGIGPSQRDYGKNAGENDGCSRALELY